MGGEETKEYSCNNSAVRKAETPKMAIDWCNTGSSSRRAVPGHDVVGNCAAVTAVTAAAYICTRYQVLCYHLCCTGIMFDTPYIPLHKYPGISVTPIWRRYLTDRGTIQTYYFYTRYINTRGAAREHSLFYFLMRALRHKFSFSAPVSLTFEDSNFQHATM